MWQIVLLLLAAFVLLSLVLVVAIFVTVAATVAAYVMPVALIVLGAWLLLRALGDSNETHHARTAAQPQAGASRQATRQQAPQRPDGAAMSAARPAPARRRQLPIDLQVKAEQIRHKADLLLGYADRFGPFSHDLYLVRQTTADYLPRTIAAYLAIPGLDDPPVGATGRTALEELRAQLQLLDGKLDEITHNLQRHDLDGLLVNRRFLEARFGLHERGAEPGLVPQTTGAA